MRNEKKLLALPFVCMIGFWGCEHFSIESQIPSAVTPLAGGETTVFDNTSQAFSLPASNLTGVSLGKHFDGDAAFEDEFVAAPAAVNSGLGPVFNSNSCVSCHPGDGRGRPPFFGQAPVSIFLRISIPGVAPSGSGGPNPVPGFGAQLFDKSLFGVTPMATFSIEYVEQGGSFDDGEVYSLRAPTYRIQNPYQPMPSNVMTSPRVALPVFGRGLLEAISENTLLFLADEADANTDGISGRANYVWDYSTGARAIGRFGWKANNPTLLQQVAGAYHGDMGVTNPLFQIESSFGAPQFDGKTDDPEIDEEILEVATFYMQTLAVPARRNFSDPLVQRGEKLFEQAHCSGCHIPQLATGSLANVPEVSNQTIFPYTDLLLHDMGESLADNRPDYLADGREWRTPPLWGIGLTERVNGHTFFLHDGRARNFIEAIMWHGGEAEPSKENFRRLTKNDRTALVAFLESL